MAAEPKTSTPQVATSTTQPEGTHAAFFYGTLMASEVFYTVCLKDARPPAAIQAMYTFQPAMLHGYSRRHVKHADYPGITPDGPEATVRGTLVTGLTDANLWHLDYFEGSEYERRVVKVRVMAKAGDGDGEVETGEEVEADVYIFKNKDRLSENEWDFDEFRREKMRFWTRAEYAFADCDPNDLATTAV